MPVKGIAANFVYDFQKSNMQLVKGSLDVDGQSLVGLLGRFKRASEGNRCDGRAKVSYR